LTGDRDQTETEDREAVLEEATNGPLIAWNDRQVLLRLQLLSKVAYTAKSKVFIASSRWQVEPRPHRRRPQIHSNLFD
jgi:hypothetical protein